MRLNATAPMWPCLRDNASARFTAALGLKYPVAPVAPPAGYGSTIVNTKSATGQTNRLERPLPVHRRPHYGNR